MQSIISYGIIFWGNAADCYLNRAFILQKRALRNICQVPPRTPCRQIFIDPKILTLTSIYILETLCFVKRKPEIFNENLLNHKYNTRNKNNFKPPAHKTAKYEKSPHYMGVVMYNKLPKILKEEVNVKIFKYKIKEILVQKAYYNITEFLDDMSVFSAYQ